MVSLAGTTELPDEVIMRKDRPVGLLETRASDEFAILRAVHAHGGVPVAQPFFADDTQNLSGDNSRGTLLVMARVRGDKAGEYFPDLAAPPHEYRRAIGSQLAAALAHLHAVPLDTLAGTALDVQASVSEASLKAAINGMAARIGDLTGPPIAAVPLARQWLLDHIADVLPSGPLSACSRATSDCTTPSSRETASPRWWTGRRPPSAHRRVSWQRPGPPPRR